MHDATDDPAIHPEAPPPGEAALRTRFERLRALRSAWGVLAPSGLSGEKQHIAESGRGLSEDLLDLLTEAGESLEAAVIADLDGRLDELERDMRDVAFEVPVAQLRSTLPERIAVDRRGVLDLLDLVLGAELAGQGGTAERIPTLDYLITLLCTSGDPESPLQDPVTLTPRLHALCARSDIDYDPRLPELEAEFFGAADLHEADVRAEVELRTLRRRKMELGEAFFAPRVLRAVMTYNAALLRRIDEEVLRSQDWGALPSAPDDGAEHAGSVFDTSVLPRLAEALRRREAGDPPAHDALDRIAWCLDIAALSRPERDALLAEHTGGATHVEGTAILVGLLLRSAVVLDEEYPAIGLSPAALSGAWALELDAALHQEMNGRIANNDYDGACALQDLSGKFLGATKAGTPRERRRRPRPTTPAPDDAQTAQQAKEIASQALSDLPRAQGAPALRDRPWVRLLRSGAAALAVGVALVLLYPILFDASRVGGQDLAAISPYLASGKRSAEGIGPAFVGTLDDAWQSLGATEQMAEAEVITALLREQGVREIMIYDDVGLRIQALGDHGPRLVDGAGDR